MRFPASRPKAARRRLFNVVVRIGLQHSTHGVLPPRHGALTFNTQDCHGSHISFKSQNPPTPETILLQHLVSVGSRAWELTIGPLQDTHPSPKSPDPKRHPYFSPSRGSAASGACYAAAGRQSICACTEGTCSWGRWLHREYEAFAPILAETIHVLSESGADRSYRKVPLQIFASCNVL